MDGSLFNLLLNWIKTNHTVLILNKENNVEFDDFLKKLTKEHPILLVFLT